MNNSLLSQCREKYPELAVFFDHLAAKQKTAIINRVLRAAQSLGVFNEYNLRAPESIRSLGQAKGIGQVSVYAFFYARQAWLAEIGRMEDQAKLRKLFLAELGVNDQNSITFRGAGSLAKLIADGRYLGEQIVREKFEPK